jgi:hypothetical protein
MSIRTLDWARAYVTAQMSYSAEVNAHRLLEMIERVVTEVRDGERAARLDYVDEIEKLQRELATLADAVCRWREWKLSIPAASAPRERELLDAYEALGTGDEYRPCGGDE